jgi:hypothetical protein
MYRKLCVPVLYRKTAGSAAGAAGKAEAPFVGVGDTIAHIYYNCIVTAGIKTGAAGNSTGGRFTTGNLSLRLARDVMKSVFEMC